MPDFIPANDDRFDSFFAALNAFALAHAADLGLDTARQARLATLHDVWKTHWAAWQAEQNVYNALLAAKNQARAAAVGFIREVNASAQAAPAVTNTAREAAGLPVRKTHRTPTPSIETHPVIYKVDNDHLLQRLWFCDQNTPGTKAKPPGATLCEIRRTVVEPGGAAPTHPAAMGFLVLGTRSPQRVEFSADDAGRSAYYCQRWVNTRGEPGPWALITSYLVV